MARRKLQTPRVFTQETASLPTSWVDMAGSSSRVMRMRYDHGNSQVHVNFVDGTPWVYEDVPYTVYEMFLTSSSKGRFIHDVLDRYPYRHAYSEEVDEW